MYIFSHLTHLFSVFLLHSLHRFGGAIRILFQFHLFFLVLKLFFIRNNSKKWKMYKKFFSPIKIVLLVVMFSPPPSPTLLNSLRVNLCERYTQYYSISWPKTKIYSPIGKKNCFQLPPAASDTIPGLQFDTMCNKHKRNAALLVEIYKYKIQKCNERKMAWIYVRKMVS